MKQREITLIGTNLQELEDLITKVIKNEMQKLISPNNSCQTIRLLTRREVASLIQVSLPTLDRMTKEGQIPCYRLPNGSKRFRESEVLSTLQELKSIKYKLNQ